MQIFARPEVGPDHKQREGQKDRQTNKQICAIINGGIINSTMAVRVEGKQSPRDGHPDQAILCGPLPFPVVIAPRAP